jgi:hypothetical protein
VNEIRDPLRQHRLEVRHPLRLERVVEHDPHRRDSAQRVDEDETLPFVRTIHGERTPSGAAEVCDT